MLPMRCWYVYELQQSSEFIMVKSETHKLWFSESGQDKVGCVDKLAILWDGDEFKKVLIFIEVLQCILWFYCSQNCCN